MRGRASVSRWPAQVDCTRPNRSLSLPLSGGCGSPPLIKAKGPSMRVEGVARQGAGFAGPWRLGAPPLASAK